MPQQLRTNFFSPWNCLSYGYVSVNIIKALLAEGVEIAHQLIGQQPDFDNQDDIEVYQSLQRPLQHFGGMAGPIFFADAPSIKLWHAYDVHTHVSGRTRIGFPIGELDKFSDLEKESQRACELLFVPSEWARTVVLQELGPKWEFRTFVVPLGVDSKVFFPDTTLRPQIPDGGPFTILYQGKIEIRKSIELVRDIFNAAFDVHDDVELIMSITNVFASPEEHKEWENYYLDSKLGRAGKIKFMPRFQSEVEVAKLVNSCHCLLAPYKAEGWALPVLNALACGLSVIATNYSGPTEYLTNENALLIDIDELEPANDGKWFFGEGNWAKFGDRQIEQTIAHLRKLYFEYGICSAPYGWINDKGIETAKRFSWSSTAQRITEILQFIGNGTI